MPLRPEIVVYGPPEIVDLLILYVAAPVVTAHDNVTSESPGVATKTAGAAGSAGSGFALISPEFGPSPPAELTPETT